MDRELLKLKRLTAQMVGWETWKDNRSRSNHWSLDRHLGYLDALTNNLILAGQSSRSMPEGTERSQYGRDDRVSR
jgi:hypothetical protein